MAYIFGVLMRADIYTEALDWQQYLVCSGVMEVTIAELSLTSELLLEQKKEKKRKKKNCWKFMHPYYTFILIKQRDYTDFADKDYQNRMAPPAPCNPIN